MDAMQDLKRAYIDVIADLLRTKDEEFLTGFIFYLLKGETTK